MWVGRDGTRGPIRYFDVTEELEQAAANPIPWSPSALREALLDTLKHHLVSDVPVGRIPVRRSGFGHDHRPNLGIAADALRSVTLAFDEYNGTEFDEAALAEISPATTKRRTKRNVSKAPTSMKNINGCAPLWTSPRSTV